MMRLLRFVRDYAAAPYPTITPPVATVEYPIIRWDGPDDGGNTQRPFLDEFVARNVNIHFEAMGDAQFWIGIDDPVTGRSWMLNCGAVNHRAKGYAMVESDDDGPQT